MCQLDGGGGGVGGAHGVDHHEVVDDPAEADLGDRDTGLAQFGRVCLALVAQHVGLAGDHQCGRQPPQLVDRRAQRGGVDLLALGVVVDVLVPEPFHSVAGEEVVFGELVVGVGVEVGVGDRVQQYLLVDAHVAAVLGHKCQGDAHIAAHRVAGDRETGCVEAFFGAVGEHPLRGGVVLFDGCRVFGFG